jgi:hypothetical protein
MKTMNLILLTAAVMLSAPSMVLAQSSIGTVNGSVSITTGLTFQQIFPASSQRQSVEFENNNITSTENCWINYDGTVTAGMTTSSTVTTTNGTMTAQKASIYLAPSGGSATRYTLHMPNAIVVGTCTTAGDSIYATVQ